jgi:hypothetical protein
MCSRETSLTSLFPRRTWRHGGPPHPTPLPPPPAGAALQPLTVVEVAAARRHPSPLPPPNPLSSIPNLHSASLYISRAPPFPPAIYPSRPGIATACAPSSSGHFIPVPPLPCTAVRQSCPWRRRRRADYSWLRPSRHGCHPVKVNWRAVVTIIVACRSVSHGFHALINFCDVQDICDSLMWESWFKKQVLWVYDVEFINIVLS